MIACMISCNQGGDKVAERNIAIRVDEELFKKIKIRLADNGMTLKDYIISLIEEDLMEDVHFNLKAVPALKAISETNLKEAQKVLDFVGDIISGKYSTKE